MPMVTSGRVKESGVRVIGEVIVCLRPLISTSMDFLFWISPTDRFMSKSHFLIYPTNHVSIETIKITLDESHKGSTQIQGRRTHGELTRVKNLRTMLTPKKQDGIRHTALAKNREIQH